MRLLFKDPALRRRLGENGGRKVMDGFSLDRSTAKVRDLLLRASGTRKPLASVGYAPVVEQIAEMEMEAA
jgi:hypothetical protein